ncbi:MAG: phytoene desaturase family protein [Spirulina sp.]
MADTTDIVIIGAGVAGLAAGCYAQMNGYRSRIIEAQAGPGGSCWADWQQGYCLEGGLHYIFGNGPGQPFYTTWEELGVIPQVPFLHEDYLAQLYGPNGEVLTVHSDTEVLAEHMKALAPQDAKLIDQFCKGVRNFKAFDLSILQQKPKSLMTGADWARIGRQVLPFVNSLGKWGSLSLQDLGTKFKDPFLQRAVPHMFSWPEVPVMVGMSLLAYLDNGNAGFPQGGSLAFVKAIEQRYLSLGGEIYYSTPVEQILLEGDEAVGVRLADQREYRAGRVISACDGRHTLFNLLQGEYLHRRLERIYGSDLPMYSQFQVCLGVNRDLSADPHWSTYLLEEPLTIAGAPQFEIGLKHYNIDPSLAPPGKSVLMALMTTPYRHWQTAYGNGHPPENELPEVQTVLEWLNQRYPGLSSDIEVMQVRTPLSHERTTRNWQGSSCGWLLTKDTLPMMVQGIPKRLPGLKNFAMIGHWTEPGGSIPIAAMSGRNLVYELCHEDSKPFATA